ncbi:PRC-barrel domain-containing protein [Heliophilum fasciatum]|uniref:Uncharacterized protein YrrD n=1 Tax=Heliophilum fasciatum TaxID=35700 RepID=A0A4R2RPN4_9FIRM|nr:PRC-barrel domain-containing protein [Heliophilum fasciatum]MCW2278043.1 sporulation protein YlmC with PRC-barrel domain [Heliophilum fasciatum]TCP64337.1 uncharacterized protein YrrD [Heliophilum fasciatum]
MCKGRDIVQLPVCNATQQTIAHVQDLLVDLAEARVTAVVLQPAQGGGDCLRWPQVQIDRDAVHMQGDPCPQTTVHVRPTVPVKELTGTPVVTATGHAMGKVGDVLIDPATGQLLGVEVTDGWTQDMLTGRLHVPWSDVRGWQSGRMEIPDRWQDAWQLGS